MSTNTVLLEELMVRGQPSLDPRNSPTEEFELYSIPAYDKREPEHVLGREVGSSKKIVEHGDLLLSRIVPHIRRAWVVPPGDGKRQIASGEWIVFRHDSFEPRYLRHFVMGDPFHAQFMNTVAGVGGSLVRARPENVGRIEVSLPPLSEQKRIADILDKADAIRRKRQEAVESLGAMRQATLYDIVLNSKKRGDWPEERLGDIADVKGGIALSSRRSDLERQAPYLRVANVYRDRLDLSEIKIIGLTNAELERTKLLFGDVLIVEGHGNRDEIGRSAIWDGSIADCVHQNHLIRVRPKDSIIRSVYLSAFINSPLGRRQLFRFGKTTSGLNTISLSNVRDTVILLPPLALQQHMEKIIAETTRLMIPLNAAFDYANDLFNSLVQRAFKGEL